MMHRQHIDQCTEPDAAGALRHRRAGHAWRRRGVERCRMMLARMISAKAGAVVELDQREPLLVLLGERIRTAVVLIEYAKLHRASRLLDPAYSAACDTGWPIMASSRAHSAR